MYRYVYMVQYLDLCIWFCTLNATNKPFGRKLFLFIKVNI